MAPATAKVDDDGEEGAAVGIETVETVVTEFAGIRPLSRAASDALTKARFVKPSPIQATAIPHLLLSRPRSMVYHYNSDMRKISFLDRREN